MGSGCQSYYRTSKSQEKGVQEEEIGDAGNKD
jgi:hypothetical protein